MDSGHKSDSTGETTSKTISKKSRPSMMAANRSFSFVKNYKYQWKSISIKRVREVEHAEEKSCKSRKRRKEKGTGI
jgi:hypothetical protein